MTSLPQSTPYAIRRSTRARRARLTVTDAGEALVVLPPRAPQQLADELVARHQAWLERHRRRILAERSALRARPALGAGRTLALGGVEHRITLAAAAGNDRSRIRLDGGPPPAIVVALKASEAISVAALLERWLRALARQQIGAVVAERAAEMGLAPARLTVRDQRTRWGSASGTGTLSFSWRLVLCPPEVLDYVVVHELAHLRWRGHGARFWALVGRHVPDAAEHRRWLRHNHRQLQAALD